MQKAESVRVNEISKILGDSGQKTWPIAYKKKRKEKENLPSSMFYVSADHKVKIKESKNIEKYLNLARELTKM